MSQPANVLKCWTCGKSGQTCPRRRGQTVLVVDDDVANRDALRRLLEQDGYCVLQADNGFEAVALFVQHTPDMILMDVHMPVMDGYRAAARIREMAEEQGMFCPILFLSGQCDEGSLERTIACGGDDFLVKPYSHKLLRAKMQALGRMGNLYGVVQNQRDELRAHHERLRNEHEIAERTLTRIMESGCLDSASIRHRISPIGISSGDMILSALRPDGTQQFLLGDFTGHGLSAAIGAIPVSDTFLSMTRKGFGVGMIAAEINRKLKRQLPAELFLAACLLEVDPARAELRCWNGGIPDVLLFRPGHGVAARATSRHLPLGIVDAGFDAGTETVALRRGDCIVVHSDGVTEAVSAGGAMFGDERLAELIRAHRRSDALFDLIWDTVDAFRQGREQNDDISLLEIRFDGSQDAGVSAPLHDAGDGAQAVQRMEFDFDAATLRGLDAQKLVADWLRCLKPLRPHRIGIYTVVSELFCNALEHGVLRLDSGLKRDAAGFEAYYLERARRLESLQDGWIRIAFELSGTAERGELRIGVSDSGSGFDHGRVPLEGDPPEQLSRRGLALVRGLCRQVTFGGAGNRVEALYAWDGP